MPNLSEDQLGGVRALIRAASDAAIRDLELTLSSGAERHETMRAIQQMVMVEAADRRARNSVFAPLVPMCAPKAISVHGVIFPATVLAHVWRGLKEECGAEVQSAARLLNDPDEEPRVRVVFDAFCHRAANGVRERSNPGYEAAAKVLDASSPGSAETFAVYLDLAPVARAALERLPEWLGRATEERVAAARIAFADATSVSEDCGPRLMEILYTHLAEPWTILRLVSAVMHRPGDRYVATSELASFGDRLLDDVDHQLQIVATFDADLGAPAGVRAGVALRVAAAEIQEFDETIELSKEGPWGARLTRQKRALSQAVESRLKSVEAEVAAALPLQSAGFRHKGVRGHPKLAGDPDERLVNRARAFLSLLHESRPSAERLGYGSLWNKTTEALQTRIANYVEDLLEKLRNPEEEEHHARVRLFLDVSAEFMGFASDDKAAQIVRRRMAAAA